MLTNTEAERDETTERLDKEARAILAEVVRVLREELPEASISDPDESPYASDKWDAGACSVIERAGHELCDVRVECHASTGYEGEMLGWSFGFASTLEGGRIGPGGTMFNYSDSVWTEDPAEIADRLQCLRNGAEDFAVEVAEFLRREA